MNRFALSASFAALLVVATLLGPAPAARGSQGPLGQEAVAQDVALLPFVPAAPDGATARAVAAAEAFLATLDDAQRAAAVFPFDDEAQRARWSNLPTGMFARRGLRMGDLDEAQRAAVFGLLGALLSPAGLREVRDNMGGDQVLLERGSSMKFGEDEFYVSLLGAPALDAPWAVQFGGHHLALNATVVGERVALVPALTGGQPMHYERAGREVELMAAETAAARRLLAALDDGRRAVAVQGSRHVDLSWGPGREAPADARGLPAPVGLAGADMTDDQRALLRELVAARVGLLNGEDAAELLARLDADLGATRFAWFGPTGPDGVASYRVQGPRLFVEYAPQGRGAGDPEHVHAIWRDPTNEYGRGFAHAGD